MAGGNLEVVVAPFNVWWAPTGTAKPDIGVDVPAAWGKVGLDQSRSFDESGIQASRAAADGEFRGYGAGRVRKLWTISEDLSFQFMVADFTLETMSLLIEDNQTLTETAGTTTGVVRSAYVTDDGTSGYSVGQTLTLGATSANVATFRVTKVRGGKLLAVEIIDGGSGQTAGEKTQGSSASTSAFTGGTGAKITIEVYTPAATKSLILGRRGANLAKAEFSFLMRGLASPYVADGRAQIHVPIGSFEGSRDIAFTRNDPIKYGCTIRCVEDSTLDGYAELIAVAA